MFQIMLHQNLVVLEASSTDFAKKAPFVDSCVSYPIKKILFFIRKSYLLFINKSLAKFFNLTCVPEDDLGAWKLFHIDRSCTVFHLYAPARERLNCTAFWRVLSKTSKNIKIGFPAAFYIKVWLEYLNEINIRIFEHTDKHALF